MSSITTVIPSGILPAWCLSNPWGWEGPNDRHRCGSNSSAVHDPVDANYWNVCCDGDIVYTKGDIWSLPRSITIDDLVCCRYLGKLQGGVRPLPTGPPWTCDNGQPTPLASLAATNTDNARDYLATYASANDTGGTLTDMFWTETPWCLWVDTKTSGGVPMATVTVPAASFITLSETSSWIMPEPVSPTFSSDWGHTASTSGPRTTQFTSQPAVYNDIIYNKLSGGFKYPYFTIFHSCPAAGCWALEHTHVGSSVMRIPFVYS